MCYDIIKLYIDSLICWLDFLERNEIDEKAMDKVLFTADEFCYFELAY